MAGAKNKRKVKRVKDLVNGKDVFWFPIIDFKKCNGCMACVKKCTRGVFAEEAGKPKVVEPFNCAVGCTGCEPVCPKKALMHQPSYYLRDVLKHGGSFTCSCGGR